jgi:hypothetical protein
MMKYDEENREVFKDWIGGVLRMHETYVTFTKKDGTERQMRCTLQEDRLPDIEKSTLTSARKKPEDSIAVYDLDLGEWRAFRYDSVKEVKFAVVTRDAV